MKKQITLLAVLALLFAGCSQKKDLSASYGHVKVLNVKNTKKFFTKIQNDSKIFTRLRSLNIENINSGMISEKPMKVATYAVPLLKEEEDEKGKKAFTEIGEIICTVTLDSSTLYFRWKWNEDLYPIKIMAVNDSGYLTDMISYNDDNEEGPFYDITVKSEYLEKYYPKFPLDASVGKQLADALIKIMK